MWGPFSISFFAFRVAGLLGCLACLTCLLAPAIACCMYTEKKCEKAKKTLCVCVGESFRKDFWLLREILCGAVKAHQACQMLWGLKCKHKLAVMTLFFLRHGLSML